MRLIAFCGPKGVGKTSAALYLAEKYNGHVFAWGDEVKVNTFSLIALPEVVMMAKVPIVLPTPACPILVPKDMNREYAIRFINAYKHELREVLQSVGEAGRQNNEKLWIDMAVRNLMQVASDGKMADKQVLINDDTRHLAEAEYLSSQGFTLIKINPRVPRTDPHVSENQYKEIQCDYEFTQPPDLDGLYRNLDAIWGELTLSKAV